MKNSKIAELIQKKYEFLNKPTESEVKKILSKINNSTSEEEFDQIVSDIISDTTCYCNESADMSDTINILDQIKKVLDGK
ncbi:hypothetical protein [Aliarcobacter skirrowii]|uniref:Uncharacterized protein n=1 Tax=Aliarcobacter skirrowii CCUG 10374 TaxID=1032239 RepID=A0AAD0SL25_9BACT|nr:hypothetical protein [Aliarcobacter skirrowii]AXX84608.1 hypothetical protein ASKIR_0786 [Aliarcobacter skirrowii CCUG 10374]KAB0619883.1 hypothetical protein F7P70_09480 [Aliarcobacter skirrowii CCUG 10374]RXI24708.1 hypothetical protein CP959_09735 [Aliarcobacter skirrowii CCUG 10374]SUV14774.1 Uncharacterised protein [Aliarcobacter skirrowii]